MRYVILSALLLLFFPKPSLADLFTWQENGQTYMTDDISKVPPEYRKNRTPDPEPDARQGKRKEEKAPAYKKKAEEPDCERECEESKEQYWRSLASELRYELREQELTYEELSREEQDCQSQNKPATGKRHDCAYYERQKLYVQQNISRLKRALEVDLPDQARKAGASPGWIRE